MILRATEDSKADIQEKAKAKIVLEISKEENKITQKLNTLEQELPQLENNS